MDPVTLLLRWAHVLAAIVALGGLFFARFALVPAADELGRDTADRLHAGIRRRWLPWVIGAITLLLVSGLVGRGAGTQWIRDSRKQWLSVTVGLGVAAVLVSGWMRQLHTGANDLPDPVKVYARDYLRDIESANAVGGRDDDDAARGGGRPARDTTPPAPALEEKPDGQEAKEADGGAPSEDREAPAAADGGEAAA